jgi:hypothetical protein
MKKIFFQNQKLIFLLFLVIIIFQSCKKEAEWIWCTNCTMEKIIGTYEGTANHLRFVDTIFVETKGKESYLNLIEENGLLKVQVGIVNLFSLNVTGEYTNDYYIEIPGNRSRLSVKIWQKENQIKLIGTAKKFTSNGDILELIDFEVFKTE